VHHNDEFVRRRCFYLLRRFTVSCGADLDIQDIAPILDTLKVSVVFVVPKSKAQPFEDLLVIDAKLPEPETPEDDLLARATTGKCYFADQLHLFESAGVMIHSTRNDSARQIQLLEVVAGPLMSDIANGLQSYRRNDADLSAILLVHHNLMALGNVAKGFPRGVSDSYVETMPYQAPFKQMTEALLEALDVMKTQKIVRDSVSVPSSKPESLLTILG
jgi:exportin-T